MKSIFRGSALLATALMSGSLVFSARPLAAETLLSQFQQKAQPVPQVQKQESTRLSSAANDATPAPSTGALTPMVVEMEPAPALEVSPPIAYVATAYCLRGRTASGRMVSKGLIAADPKLLPLGSRVRLEAGGYSGEYLVADTGGAVRGRRIDIWTPTSRQAFSFGRRQVRLTVLSYGLRRTPARRSISR